MVMLTAWLSYRVSGANILGMGLIGEPGTTTMSGAVVQRHQGLFVDPTRTQAVYLTR